MTGEFVEFRLQDFLYNAGVVGLIHMLRYDEDYGDCCEGREYQLSGQSLLVSRDYLLTRDLGKLFVDTLVYHLKEQTKFSRVLAEKAELDKLYAQANGDYTREFCKKADELYKPMLDMLNKPSYQSAYQILRDKGVDAPIGSLVAKIKASKEDQALKKATYDELHALLQQDEIERQLVFRDIMYDQIKLFYVDNKGSGAAFFHYRETDPGDAFNQKFVDPLRLMIGTEEADVKQVGGRVLCIQCGKVARGKTPLGTYEELPLSTFTDTANDLGKKRSYYWNLNPDAYLCPLCAFVCALAPLGFEYRGRDAIFINNNSDVSILLGSMNALNQREVPSNDGFASIYAAFTMDKLTALKERLSNIQVIIREKDLDHYSMRTVDRSAIEVFVNCRRDFERIRPLYAKYGNTGINVFRQCIENVVLGRNQYPLIALLLRIALDSGRRIENLGSILNIQINSKGGNKVEGNIKRAYVAKQEGSRLRALLTKDVVLEADKDNRLRGLVYQLLNAASLVNRERYLELLIRTYSGIGKPVPDILFGCFESDEDFQQLAFAFLLGLKSGAEMQGKRDNKEENTNA